MGEPRAPSVQVQLPQSAASAAAAAEAVVRRFEGLHGRQLIDTRIGGWADMPSEAALKAAAHWRLKVRVSTSLGPRYLSVRDGEPQRFIDIHVLSERRRDLRLRHSQLLRAAELGPHGWLYAVVTDAAGEQAPRGGLLLLQDPVRAAWTAPISLPGSVMNGADLAWRLSQHELDRHAEKALTAA